MIQLHDAAWFARELRRRGWSDSYAASMGAPLAALRRDSEACAKLAPVLDFLAETCNDEVVRAGGGLTVAASSTAEDFVIVLRASIAEPG
jgi:hypothetical protein